MIQFGKTFTPSESKAAASQAAPSAPVFSAAVPKKGTLERPAPAFGHGGRLDLLA